MLLLEYTGPVAAPEDESERAVEDSTGSEGWPDNVAHIIPLQPATTPLSRTGS